MLERYDFAKKRYSKLAQKSLVVTANEWSLLYCVLNEQDIVGEGYGYRYTEEMVSELGKKNLYPGFVNFLSQDGQKFFREKLKDERIFFDAPVESYKLRDPQWHFQGIEPTCGAWALANAALALDKPLQPDFLAILLNEANNVDRLSDIVKIDAGITLSDPNVKSGLEFEVIDYHLTNSDSEIRLGPLITEIELKNYQDYLCRSIKSGATVLETVNAGFYGLKRKTGLHEIAVIGYEATPIGTVNFQVLDSNLGQLIVPLEFVYKTRAGQTVTVRKNRTSF